ncbi:MAG TPA: YceI family protein [Thermoanaerobaculia bacterium]|jgi:polyisoprenoid-binding protein YceI
MRRVVFFVAAVFVSWWASAQPAELHYAIDAAGSELGWELPATLHTVHGKAPELSGTVDAVLKDNGEWSIQAHVVVKAAAMVTGNASRDRNMREKVLETDRYPEIVFEARRVRADLSRLRPGERVTAEAEGDLTVHGKPASIRVPVDVLIQADGVILEGTFPLSWKQYGLHDPSFGVVTVRDPLKVHFRLRAVAVPR